MNSHGPSGAVEPAVRLNLRPLGNPLPLGLYAFGIGMLLLAAQTAGWIPVAETKQVGLLLFTFVFPLEGTAAIMAFLARDTLAATVLGMFTTSWLALGLASYTGVPGVPVMAIGFYLMAFAAPILVMAALAGLGKPLISVTLVLSGARAILDGLYQLSGTTSVEHASGYVAAAIAGVALYAGTAFLLEDLGQHAVLPVFRRGAGATAMEADLSEQLGRARGEAGVRQQL